MVDVFVDKIIHNAQIKKEWEKTTKDLFKVYSYWELLESFMSIAEEYNEEFYTKYNPIQKKNTQFKGVSIIQIADDYGLKPFGKKVRICPFHTDTSPSLSLNEEKGVFKCFGCGLKGNIVKFKAMLNKQNQNGNNKG